LPKLKHHFFRGQKWLKCLVRKLKMSNINNRPMGEKFAPNLVTLLTSAVAVEFPFSSFRFSIFRQTAGYPPTYLLNDFYLPIGGVIFVGNIAIIPTHG
jgi:hypothetical protein